MKKKLISLVLAGAMLLGMAGCAEKPGASEEGKKEDKGCLLYTSDAADDTLRV